MNEGSFKTLSIKQQTLITLIRKIVILLAYKINFDGYIIVSLFGQPLECWKSQISDQFLPVKEDNLDVDILAILMEEVF